MKYVLIKSKNKTKHRLFLIDKKQSIGWTFWNPSSQFYKENGLQIRQFNSTDTLADFLCRDEYIFQNEYDSLDSCIEDLISNCFSDLL